MTEWGRLLDAVERRAPCSMVTEIACPGPLVNPDIYTPLHGLAAKEEVKRLALRLYGPRRSRVDQVSPCKAARSAS